jgi:tRNA nucleotidyltransferase (CCA-adding enzyme)
MIYERYVTHAMVRDFAKANVNLRREDVKEYRDQVGRLRTKLEEHIAAHPDYGLVKMRNSGSVAKGTALKTINDMDVAVYVRAEAAPDAEPELLSWLEERLKEAYPNHPPQNIVSHDHCVRITFTGSGLDVDVVPVLYEGVADDVGYLIEKFSGDRVKTSVTQHLKFIRTRKDRQPEHFAQVVRLVKWWVRQVRRRQADFRFKSFMIELVCAHMADEGLDFSDYPTALEEIFAYIVSTELDERIAFTDFKASALPQATSAEIEIFDPVNAENNVAVRYSRQQRLAIVEAAQEAGDALAEAAYATTKQRAVERWRTVLGPSFNP